MAEKARNYPDVFTWLVQTRSQEGTYGSEPATYTPSILVLRGRLEYLSAAESISEGLTTSEITAKITIQNVPAVKEGDRLFDKSKGRTWLVKAIKEYDAEIECQVQNLGRLP